MSWLVRMLHACQRGLFLLLFSSVKDECLGVFMNLVVLYCRLAQHMLVLNLSQQTESSDLLGGFCPVPASRQMLKLLGNFNELFTLTFTRGKNEQFLLKLRKLGQRERWSSVMQAFQLALLKVAELESQQQKANSSPDVEKSRIRVEAGGTNGHTKRRQIISESLRYTLLMPKVFSVKRKSPSTQQFWVSGAWMLSKCEYNLHILDGYGIKISLCCSDIL